MPMDMLLYDVEVKVFLPTYALHILYIIHIDYDHIIVIPSLNIVSRSLLLHIPIIEYAGYLH